MSKAVAKAIVLLALAVLLEASKPIAKNAIAYRGQRVVHITGVNGTASLEIIEESVQQILRKEYGPGGITARVSPWQIPHLEQMGFQVSTIVEDVAEALTERIGVQSVQRSWRTKADKDDDAYFKSYHPYMAIYDFIDELMAMKPAEGMPESWRVKRTVGKTVENRPIHAVELGNPDAKYIIYMQGGIHGSEWLGTCVTQYALREYMKKFVSGSHKEVFDEYLFVFLPLMNVDGYRFAFTSERLWRKNRAINKNESCIGVDLNRNFNGFNGWKLGEDQCSRNYGGPTPYSEPETKAVVDYLQSLKKRSPVVAMFEMHTHAEFLLYPYGYDFNLPDAPNRKELEELGNVMAKAINEVDNQNYTTRNAVDWYPGSGCTDDYFYDKVARNKHNQGVGYVYTVELRPQEGDPFGDAQPADQILITCQEWFSGFEAGFKWISKKLQES